MCFSVHLITWSHKVLHRSQEGDDRGPYQGTYSQEVVKEDDSHYDLKPRGQLLLFHIQKHFVTVSDKDKVYGRLPSFLRSGKLSAGFA